MATNNDVIASLALQVGASTVRLRQEMNSAAQTTRVAARQMREDLEGARGTVRVLGEELGIHLNRHLSTFIARLPGIAPALSAAFSTVAVVGIGMALAESTKRLVEFVTKAREAAGAIGEGMKAIRDRTAAANDELALSNVRLEAQIAKLEHKPTNNVALALAEARVEADKLAESLKKDLDEVDKLLKERQVGFWAGLATNQQPTGAFADRIRQYDKEMDQIAYARMQAMRGARSQGDIDRITAQYNQQYLAKAQEARDWAASQWNQMNAASTAPLAVRYGKGGVAIPQEREDLTANMTMLGSYGHQLEETITKLQLLIVQSADQARLKVDQGAAKAAEGADKGVMTLNLAKLQDEWTDELTKIREANQAFYAQNAQGYTRPPNAPSLYTPDEKWAEFFKETMTWFPQVAPTLQTLTPTVTLLPPAFQQLRDSINETVEAFTNWQGHLSTLINQTVSTFNSEVARAATGQRTSFARAFQGVGASAVGKGLEIIEGTVAKHIPALEKWLHAGKAVQSMTVSAQNVVISTQGVAAGSGSVAGPLSGMPTANLGPAGSGIVPASTQGWVQFAQLGLGLVRSLVGGGAGAPAIAPGLDTSLDSYQIPYQQMDLLPLTGRAFGGPVLAGIPYDVGEMGRETFVPHSDGQIVPNRAMGNAYYHIDARGADAAAVSQRVRAALEQVHGQAVRTSVSAMREQQRRSPSRGM